MKTAFLTAAALAVSACAAAGDPETESLQQAATAEPENYYAIHLSGLCSTQWEGGKGNGFLGTFEGITSISAQVDQTTSMEVATADFARTLDTYCTGNNWCYVFTYSNGGAVASRTLSLYETTWNILWVLSSASNEGGSEIGGTGWVGEVFGGCELAGHIGPSDHRGGWNHNDTGGTTFYMVGGYANFAPWMQSWFLPGEDDGAVAYHSAGGYNDTYSTSNLCGDEGAHWANHVAAYSCEGFDLDHFEMQNQGVCLAGGC